MNKTYENLNVIEYYSFKHGHDFIFMDVNTLQAYLLDNIEYQIISALNKPSTKNIRFNTLIDKYGEQVVFNKVSELLENGILKRKNKVKKLYPPNPPHNKDSLKTINAIDILISQDCNLACKYCFVKNGLYRGKSALMKLDIGRRSIDFLIDKSGNQKDLFICFFGGEPLINYRVLKGIVIYALEKGKKHNKRFHFSLTTNGTLFKDAIIEFINKHNIFILISIDGDMHSHNLNRPLSGGGDSYSQIVNNLKKLNQNGINYSARATVSSFTIDKISENFEHLVALGFKKIHFENALAPKGELFINNKEQIKKIKNQYSIISKKINKNIEPGHLSNIKSSPLPLEKIDTKKTVSYPCSAGRGSVSIDVNGDIYLCHRLVGVDTFFLGNVESTYNSKWSDIIQNEINVDKKNGCKKCWARYICGGGCYGINYEFNKDISLTPLIYCQLKKYSIKMALTVYADNAK